ncbi:MAG: hypothetical protein D5R97_09970, partial [Candidatus Syntrophonatronum acetioxidans]
MVKANRVQRQRERDKEQKFKLKLKLKKILVKTFALPLACTLVIAHARVPASHANFISQLKYPDRVNLI